MDLSIYTGFLFTSRHRSSVGAVVECRIYALPIKRVNCAGGNFMAAAIPLWMPDVRIQRCIIKPQQTMKEIFGVIPAYHRGPKGEQTIDRF